LRVKTPDGVDEGAMTRRKGELSKSTIDREWPHQVALRADECTGGIVARRKTETRHAVAGFRKSENLAAR
jgi:hypothetical protein